MQAARGAPLTPSGDAAAQGSGQSPAPRTSQRLLLALAGALVVADQVSKWWAANALADGRRVDLVGDLFGLRLTRNPGAAFGTGGAFTPLIAVIAMVATVIVLYLSRRVRDTWWAVGLGCLLAGVVGNLIDRLFRSPGPMRGHVVDFFQFPHWPIFNVADVCINVAAGVVLLQAFRGVKLDGTREPEKRHPADGAGDD